VANFVLGTLLAEYIGGSCTQREMGAKFSGPSGSTRASADHEHSQGTAFISTCILQALQHFLKVCIKIFYPADFIHISLGGECGVEFDRDFSAIGLQINN
jgi:hypothetical protein